MDSYGDSMTLAQAVGEAPFHGPAFVAGVDFDPYDEDEVAVVRLAGEFSRADRVTRLENEVASLRERLAQYEEED